MQVVLVQIPATTATCICLISLFSRVIPKKNKKNLEHDLYRPDALLVTQPTASKMLKVDQNDGTDN